MYTSAVSAIVANTSGCSGGMKLQMRVAELMREDAIIC